MSFNQRDIVLVPFPYSDLSHIKKRPVLIVSNNEFNSKNEDVIVCVITSKNYSNEYSVEIDGTSLEYGILPEPSVIKTQKLFTISKLKIIKKFSILATSKFKNVRDKIVELVEFDKTG